ncbi:MAG: phosphoglycerate kinase [bacterium]|nr:phosphoglycerate kinase [bacterium]
MKSIRDATIAGLRVLMRCDFNVPLDKEGGVTDDFRIRSTLPTIEYILGKKGKLVLMTHLGDPDGKPTKALSVERIRKKLAELLDTPVASAQDCVGKTIEESTRRMKPGDVLLLENVRFHKEEEENNKEFAQKLAALGDMYVNDAFSVCHRPHASVVGVPLLLPAYAGFFLELELQGLERLLLNPAHPVVAVIGGKKIESKLPVIDRISKTADAVLLGNILANEAKSKKVKFKNSSKIFMPLDGIPGQGKEFDIGPKTKALYVKILKNAKTVFWAGPLGKYEDARYEEGSLAVAKAIIKSNAYSIAGGGNLLAFLGKHRLREKFSHVSTGGSAMLEFLSGKKLPGLEALNYYAGN